MTYELLRLLHIVNATILVGLGLGSAFYFFVSGRGLLAGRVSADAMRHVARWVARGDAWFIAPAVVIQPLTGYAMVETAAWPWHSPWLLGSLLLFALAGACWLPVLWLQIRLRDLAADGRCDPRFRRYFTAWTVLGVPAFIAMAAIYALMVLKPV